MDGCDIRQRRRSECGGRHRWAACTAGSASAATRAPGAWIPAGASTVASRPKVRPYNAAGLTKSRMRTEFFAGTDRKYLSSVGRIIPVEVEMHVDTDEGIVEFISVSVGLQDTCKQQITEGCTYAHI